MNAASIKQNKWVRRGIVALLVLLAFWVIAWLAVPPIAKSQVQKIASEKLGRQVTVGKIDFKPWTLELTLNDLRIATADGSKAQVAIQRIYADAELQSIFRLAPVIDTVTIDAPAILLTHLADGKYDIDDILAKLSAGPPADPNAKPARFAIYNIAINGGSVDFDDQTVKRKHELRDFVLKVPFLSNLDSKRDINTEPKLAFVLNGSKFDSAALTTPFSDSRKTDAQVQFKGLDLVPYLGYMPGGLPVRLQAGSLDADLKIAFEHGATNGLKITGTVEAHTTKVADARGRDLLGFESLKLALADVRPLESVFHLSEISLVNPQLAVARDAAGQLNLLATDPATGATEKAAPLPTAAASAPAGKTAEKPVLKVQVDKIALSGGRIGWRDETVKPAAAVDVTELGFDVTGVTWPMEKPAQFSGSTAVAGASLKFKGSATDKAADVQTEVEALPLSLAAPYLAQSLEPTLDGKLSGQIDIAWAQPDLKFKARRLSADGLALTQAKTALASVGRFELVDAEADMTKHTLNVASFTATNPKVRIERDNEKRWMFERWLKTPAGGGTREADAKVAAPKPAAAETPQPGANTKPWALTIGTLAVDNGSLSYSDKASATPVAVEVTAFKLNAQKIAPDTNTVSPLQVSGRIGSAGRSADPGRFDYKGNIVLKPLAAEGRLEVASFPAHAFKAYYADALNVDIRRAFASYRGTVRYATSPAGMSIKLAGDTALDDFRANSVSLTQSPGFDRNNNQLLSWKTLSLRGLQVSMAPNAAPSVDVRETTLTDFFARVIVDPTGRLNLLSLTKKGEAEANAAAVRLPATPPPARARAARTTTSRAAPARPSGGAPVSAENMVGGAPEPAKPAATAQAAPAAPSRRRRARAGHQLRPDEPGQRQDRFHRPLRQAQLLGRPERADRQAQFLLVEPAEGRGRPARAGRPRAARQGAADRGAGNHRQAQPAGQAHRARHHRQDARPRPGAAVAVLGALRRPRHRARQDEHGRQLQGGARRAAHGHQQAGAQPAAVRRRGGGRARQPAGEAGRGAAGRPQRRDRRRPAAQRLAERPAVQRRPADLEGRGQPHRQGRDGSFQPADRRPGRRQRRVERHHLRARRLRAEPGRQGGLDKVAKALTDRPTLQMTVVGTSSLDKERDAYQRQRVRQLTYAEKRRVAVRGGQTGTDVAPVTDAEYPDLLTAVYKRADITKPRNLVGLAKELPLKDMENLLFASVPVDEESMRQLAVGRGAAVRDYLLAKGVPSERLFLGAVRTTASGNDWKPGAELSLTMK
jgi:hypothetical protein